jgi:transcriptional regulator with XRE-family HTH domain
MILENIIRLCNERNISIRKLEMETGIGNGTIARWGTSSPTLGNAKAVSDYFGVTVDELMAKEHEGQEEETESEEQNTPGSSG